MACYEYEGKGLNYLEIRGLFTRGSMLQWVAGSPQEPAIALYRRLGWARHASLRRTHTTDVAQKLDISRRLETARVELDKVSAPDYVGESVATLGRRPIES